MKTSIRRSRWLSRSVALAIYAAGALAPEGASAHPLHSEAIERPCEIHHEGDATSRVAGRCSFFVAAGYLVFKLDLPADEEGAAGRSVSGAINLGQSTGSVFVTGAGPLADGAVTLAEDSPQVVHMEPGALARWANGTVLEVSGTSVAAESPSTPIARASPKSLAEVVATYLELGFVHILPRGFDHILFVVGLFLASPRTRSLLWQISAFTVAHTVTLALGATGVIRLPPEVVEPLIALSIVWIGVENLLTSRFGRWRVVVVFCFGLLHGLGFAGVLLEIGFFGTSLVAGLLAFNVGVELGQLSVIALCFLVLGWARARPGYHRRIVVPASSAIALVGAYWVVHRTLLA